MSNDITEAREDARQHSISIAANTVGYALGDRNLIIDREDALAVATRLWDQGLLDASHRP